MKDPAPSKTPAKKRAYGNGNVYKRGKYYWYYLGDVKKSTGCTTERDARAFLAARVAEAQAHKPTVQTPYAHSVQGAWETFAGRVKAQTPMSATQLRAYERQWGRFAEFLKGRGISNLADVDKGVAEDYAALNVGLTSSSLEKCIYYVARIFDVILPEVANPFARVHPKRIATGALTKYSRLSPVEVEDLLEAAEKQGAEWHTLFLVAAHTGLRLTDCVHLRVEECDFGKRIITVRPRKTSHLKKAVTVQIPMSERLYTHLKGLVDAQYTLEAALGETPAQIQDGYFCPSIVKMYASSHSGVCDCTTRIFSAAGHPVATITENGKRYKRSFHSFRVTFASLLGNSGCPLAVATGIMGHSVSEFLEYFKTDTDVAAQYVRAAIGLHEKEYSAWAESRAVGEF